MMGGQGKEMNDRGLKVSLLIPTYNAGAKWPQVLDGISAQTIPFTEKIIIDSGSADHTRELAKGHGFDIINIPKNDFNHGYARQVLADAATRSDVCTFLTQDAIPATADSVQKLVEPFRDDEIGLAYGRQIPHDGATPLEKHARLFNYPDRSDVRGLDDRARCGFKVFFCSNSFAAYRKTVLRDLGGFPTHSIMGEDALFAAKMLTKGYKLAYVADAQVKHSHSYSLKEEFRRYFDTRVFHEQNKWIRDIYGRPSGEGLRYVRSELNYIASTDATFLFSSVSSLFAKWLGYKIGRYYRHVPKSWLRKLSMHQAYWQHV
ncbi:MAG TPA: glycosyltransferase family 2 protein [Mucilaginibacter sp.]|jgi:rhamnosyltransferase|nr:glycosyltransferase family 2 protein [Mucilaginibacter sp.]